MSSVNCGVVAVEPASVSSSLEGDPRIFRAPEGQPDVRPPHPTATRGTRRCSRDRVLQAQRAVGVLGDVLELGGHRRRPPRPRLGERRPRSSRARARPTAARLVIVPPRRSASRPGSASAASNRLTAPCRTSRSWSAARRRPGCRPHPAERHAGAEVLGEVDVGEPGQGEHLGDVGILVRCQPEIAGAPPPRSRRRRAPCAG